MTEEFGSGSEYTPSCPEYRYAPEYGEPAQSTGHDPSLEFNDCSQSAVSSAPKKRRKMRIYAYIAGAVAFIVLGSSLAGAKKGGSMAEPLFPSDTQDTYVAALTSQTAASWTAVYTVDGGASDSVEGLSYDASTNTLTLTNANVARIETNVMGNGFTVELIGSSSVGMLSVWGWDYGGSLTITGTGSLMLNSENTYSYGLIMYAECSESRLFIDDNVTLEARGSVAAVYINETVYNGDRPLIELGASAVCIGGEAAEFDTDDGIIGHYMADIEGMPVSSGDYAASRDASFIASGAPSVHIRILPA